VAYSKVIQRSHVGLPDEVPEKGFAVTCPLDRMPEQLIEKVILLALEDEVTEPVKNLGTAPSRECFSMPRFLCLLREIVPRGVLD
jgi:hypothetical protein